jgi:hypothetical protein
VVGHRQRSWSFYGRKRRLSVNSSHKKTPAWTHAGAFELEVRGRSDLVSR